MNPNEYNIDDNPTISVVVCTRDRPIDLRRCLSSIQSVAYPRDLIKVIVVSSSSKNLPALKREFSEVEFLYYPNKGLAAARNFGIDHSKGPIVAFVDDDCIVDRYWLINLVKAYNKDSLIAGVGGRVLPFGKIPDATNPYRNLILYLSFLTDNQPKHYRFVNWLVGCNFSFRRRVFEEISFNPRLGRRGKIPLSGEDVDLCLRLVEAGYKLLYAPDAIVYHKVGCERINPKYLLKWAFYDGLTEAYVNRMHPHWRPNWRSENINLAFSLFLKFLLYKDRGAFYRSSKHFIAFMSWLTRVDRIVIDKLD